MRCWVPFCSDTPDHVTSAEKSEGITFHGFPSEAHLRAAWLKALGMQDTHLQDSAVVCSQHFLGDDIYETKNGLRQIGADAIPASVQVCMICLATDNKMILMSEHNMEEAYENLTGHPVSCLYCAALHPRDRAMHYKAITYLACTLANSLTALSFQMCDLANLKQTLCVQCAQTIINFSRFRDKSLRARALMKDLVEKHKVITKQHVKIINRAKYKLKCNFVSTTMGPDHCDLHVVEHPDEDKLTESEETVQTLVKMVDVKEEQCYYSLGDEEDFEIKNEDDSHSDDANDKFVVSQKDNSISDNILMLEAEVIDDNPHKTLSKRRGTSSSEGAEHDPLKYKSGISRFTLCYEEFSHEPDCTSHISMHRQDGGGDQSLAREPRAGASSGSDAALGTAASDCCTLADSSICYRHAAQELGDDSQPSAESAPTLVALLPARLNTEVKVSSTEEADIAPSKKSKRMLAVLDGDSHNQPSVSTDDTHTNKNTFRNCFVKLCDVKKEVQKSRRPVSSCVSPIIETDCLNDDIKIQFDTHAGKRTFSCKLCEYKCAWRGNLVRHMRTHTAERPFSCKLCEYKFARENRLLLHMSTHPGEKPYSCKFCEYKCARRDLLVLHIRTHTGEKPYSCNLCEYKCARKCDLIPHMRTHTGEKPYSCKLCKYRCAQKNNLVEHMYTHTCDKPYTCNLCEYRCVRKRSLDRHMTTHTGKKPYSRKLSKYKSQKSSLVQHMNTHTGKKDYTCNLCEYKCVRKRSLVLHMSTHTGEKP